MELRIKNLTKKYGEKVALHDFTYTFTPGMNNITNGGFAMKKAMRKLMCLALVALLIASMTVPTMAVTTGNGTHGVYSYTYRVVCEETYGTAGISANKVPTYVSAYANNQVYSEEYDAWGYAGSSEDGTEYTGYVSASVTAGNTFEIGSTTVTGIVKKTWGTFYVNGDLVAGSVLAD